MTVKTIEIQDAGKSDVRINGDIVSAKWALENRFTLDWNHGVFVVSDTMAEGVRTYKSWAVALEESLASVDKNRKQRVVFTESARTEILRRRG